MNDKYARYKPSLDRPMQLTATREDPKNKPVLGLNVILFGLF